MKTTSTYHPKPRIRPLSLAARQRRAAARARPPLPGQVYTDWAAI